MNINRTPLRLNLGFMLKQPAGTSRVFNYDFENVQLGDDLTLPKLMGKSQITRTPQGLIVETTLTTSLDLECGRCLTVFQYKVSTEFTELYVFSRKDRASDEMVLPDDGVVDLGPIAREQLLIEVPINTTCKPDCQGLCITCGINLNEEQCDHEEDDIDPRMAALSSLLKKDS